MYLVWQRLPSFFSAYIVAIACFLVIKFFKNIFNYWMLLLSSFLSLTLLYTSYKNNTKKYIHAHVTIFQYTMLSFEIWPGKSLISFHFCKWKVSCVNFLLHYFNSILSTLPWLTSMITEVESQVHSDSHALQTGQKICTLPNLVQKLVGASGTTEKLSHYFFQTPWFLYSYKANEFKLQSPTYMDTFPVSEKNPNSSYS